MVHLDDRLIFSEDKDMHTEQAWVVLARLRKFQLLAKLSKCMFYVQGLEFPEFVLGVNDSTLF